MGLDMYLSARKYVSQGEYTVVNGEYLKVLDPQYEELLKFFPENASDYSDSSGGYVEMTIGYWRKANHIHNWFVQNTQGGEDKCETSYVSKAYLQDLRLLCQMVLDEPTNAHALLPVEAGPFFGTDEYDEWYFGATEHTIKVIDNAFLIMDAETDKWGLDITYKASW